MKIRWWRKKVEKVLEEYWQVEGYSDTQMVAFDVKNSNTFEKTMTLTGY